MRVWLNQAYSIRNVVARMIRDRPDIDLCVSAIDPLSPVRDVAPTFWEEPPSGAEGYPEWVLETAIGQRIEVLVPQRGRAGVAAMLDRYDEAGVAVHVAADAATLELLDDKAAFSASLAGDPVLCPTVAVTTADAFEAAVAAVTANGATACVKPIRGVYGAGYWTLDGEGPMSHLADPDARRISPAAYATVLREAERQGEPLSLLVMEYLPGPEASIDIVADRGTVMLSAVRTKLDANRQRIETRHPLIAHAAMLVARHRLHGAVNVQYRQDRESRWRILEINTRASGGASYCDEAGIPFSTTWIDVATGRAEPFDADIAADVVTVLHAERRG